VNAALLMLLTIFREIVIIDFEYLALPGERPVPHRFVAHELRSGRRFRFFWGQLQSMRRPPYATGPDVLLVAYYGIGDLNCIRALDWPMPERFLDAFVEFRNFTNGVPLPSDRKLFGALTFFGLDTTGAIEKKEMQERLGDGTWRQYYTEQEVTDYCEGDVIALTRLFIALLPHIDLPRALLRGRYITAAAAMENNGTPIDMEKLAILRAGWEGIQDQLIQAIDADYKVFDGRTFKRDRFADWLRRENIPWPLLESGQLDLSDGTFRQQAKAYPRVSPLRELRSSLSDLRLNDLTVGQDGRNRCLLSVFASSTGRNQPSNSKYIFGPSVWLRSLIKPPPGFGIAYVDWVQQELAIGAALSGDELYWDAYNSGDCYLGFGRQIGALPPEATEETHPAERELFKQCVLSTQYGVTEYGLALKINKPRIFARELLQKHRKTYAKFWRWSDAMVDTALLSGKIQTVFGWQFRSPFQNSRNRPLSHRSLRNFPMQAHGAEMLRLACCLATEREVEVCAPVHDALLICAPLDRLAADIAATRAAMAEASRVVLGGFEVRTNFKEVCWPARYEDKRGRVMWQRVTELLKQTSDVRLSA
jgi:DNA polymerase-1